MEQQVEDAIMEQYLTAFTGHLSEPEKAAVFGALLRFPDPADPGPEHPTDQPGVDRRVSYYVVRGGGACVAFARAFGTEGQMIGRLIQGMARETVEYVRGSGDLWERSAELERTMFGPKRREA